MTYEKSPRSGDTLQRAVKSPGRDCDSVTKRLTRYASLKNINCQIGVILGNLGHDELSEKLLSCSRYLAFRKYLATGELKLLCGYYCNKHMLCSCCSAARSRRLLGRWLPAIFDKRTTHRVRHYLLTLTWPPPPVPRAVAEGPGGEIYKLRANLRAGQSAWAKLWKMRKNRRSGPLRDVLGAILSVEVTRGPAGWHPHFHILVTMPRTKRIDAVEMRQGWEERTGGRQVRLDVLRQETDVVEVFKYAVKPADLDRTGRVDPAAVEVRLQVLQALKGMRLIRGYGGYFNLDEPDLTQSETVEDLGAWVDLLFKWTGSGYQLVKEVRV